MGIPRHVKQDRFEFAKYLVKQFILSSIMVNQKQVRYAGKPDTLRCKQSRLRLEGCLLIKLPFSLTFAVCLGLVLCVTLDFMQQE